MLAITMTSGRIGHWTKMRQSFARFSGLESSVHTRYSAGFITTTFAFRFSVHTMVGGSTLTEVTDDAVIPAGLKSSLTVMMLTEDAKRLIAVLNMSGGGETTCSDWLCLSS